MWHTRRVSNCSKNIIGILSNFGDIIERKNIKDKIIIKIIFRGKREKINYDTTSREC